MITAQDRKHLGRCLELARLALDQGDQPFGSVLAGPDGEVLFEDRNRVGGGDPTQHPEFALARWAAAHVPASQRAACTVYTSGEHCPMCSAAHAWVGLGRIVYAASAAQYAQWMQEWGQPSGPVRALAIHDVVDGIPTQGPVAEFSEQIKALHQQSVHRAASPAFSSCNGGSDI